MPIPKWENAEVAVFKNIWGAMPLQSTAYFRKVFPVNAPAERAILRIFVDTGYELFLNERFVAAVDEWNNTRDYDVASLVINGPNVIAVRGVNHGGHRGFALELRIFLPGGQIVTVGSGSDWLATGEEHWGWKSATYDDSQWEQVRVLDLSQSGAQQWKDRPGDHASRVIPCQSSSLFFRGETPKGGNSPFFSRKKERAIIPASVLEIIGEEYRDSLCKYPPEVLFPLKVVEANPGNGLLQNVEGLMSLGALGLQLNAEARAEALRSPLISVVKPLAIYASRFLRRVRFHSNSSSVKY